MADSAIDYVTKGWSPVAGCRPCSPGCKNDWAPRTLIRRAKPGQRFHGLVRSTPSGPCWTGEVRFFEDRLYEPLRWRSPQRVAVCFEGDLFYDEVPDEWIDRVFAVMSLAELTIEDVSDTLVRVVPRHQFLVLTKRPERMREYVRSAAARVFGVAWDMVSRDPRPASCSWRGGPIELKAEDHWPLPNVHLGVSVEDQDHVSRIADLMATPAAFRWVSLEPLLGPVNIAAVRDSKTRPAVFDMKYTPLGDLDWLVLGCEQLPGRKAGRNADGYSDHARSVIEQCRAAGVPVYVKQVPINDRVSHDPPEWPEDLRVRELPR